MRCHDTKDSCRRTSEGYWRFWNYDPNPPRVPRLRLQHRVPSPSRRKTGQVGTGPILFGPTIAVRAVTEVRWILRTSGRVRLAVLLDFNCQAVQFRDVVKIVQSRGARVTAITAQHEATRDADSRGGRAEKRFSFSLRTCREVAAWQGAAAVLLRSPGRRSRSRSSRTCAAWVCGRSTS